MIRLSYLLTSKVSLEELFTSCFYSSCIWIHNTLLFFFFSSWGSEMPKKKKLSSVSLSLLESVSYLYTHLQHTYMRRWSYYKPHVHTRIYKVYIKRKSSTAGCDCWNRWRDKGDSSKSTTLKLSGQWCIIHRWSNLTSSYLPVWGLLWNNAATFLSPFFFFFLFHFTAALSQAAARVRVV